MRQLFVALACVFALLSVAVSAAAFGSRRITHVEQDLPDNVAAPDEAHPATRLEPAD